MQKTIDISKPNLRMERVFFPIRSPFNDFGDLGFAI